MAGGVQSPDPVAVEFARRLREKLGERVAEIILFGSRARGDSRPDSDYDVLVVVADSVLARRERMDILRLAYRQARGLGFGVDVLVVTEEEKRERAKRWYTATGQAMREGIGL